MCLGLNGAKVGCKINGFERPSRGSQLRSWRGTGVQVTRTAQMHVSSLALLLLI